MGRNRFNENLRGGVVRAVDNVLLIERVLIGGELASKTVIASPPGHRNRQRNDNAVRANNFTVT